MTVLYIKEVRFLDLLHHDLATILDIDTLGGAVDACTLQVVEWAADSDVAYGSYARCRCAKDLAGDKHVAETYLFRGCNAIDMQAHAKSP